MRKPPAGYYVEGSVLVAVMASKDATPEAARAAFATEAGVPPDQVLASPPPIDPAGPLNLEVWWPPKPQSSAPRPERGGPAVDAGAVIRGKMRPDIPARTTEMGPPKEAAPMDFANLLGPKE